MDKIKAVTKRPGGKPVSTWITPSLENLQRYVGGWIEIVNLAEDLIIICDEEGKLKGYDHNCNICGHEFVGDIIICGQKNGELTDIPVSYRQLRELMPWLWKEAS